jgi:hypothetical protein
MSWMLNKAVGAVVQQAAIQLYLWPTSIALLAGRRVAAMGLAATIFGALHLPSLTLAALTVVAVVAWIVLYRRSGRMAPLVVSHLLLATVTYAALPDRLIYHLKVGSAALPEYRTLAILDSPESRSWLAPGAVRGSSDRDRVQSLYQALLGRAASPPEETHWLAVLRRRTPSQVAAMLLTCEERCAFIRQADRPSSRPNPIALSTSDPVVRR